MPSSSAIERAQRRYSDFCRFLYCRSMRSNLAESSYLSSEALARFMDYSWPGNIRELENVMKKIVALNDEDLALSELIRLRAGE